MYYFYSTHLFRWIFSFNILLKFNTNSLINYSYGLEVETDTLINFLPGSKILETDDQYNYGSKMGKVSLILITVVFSGLQISSSQKAYPINDMQPEKVWIMIIKEEDKNVPKSISWKIFTL